MDAALASRRPFVYTPLALASATELATAQLVAALHQSDLPAALAALAAGAHCGRKLLLRCG